MHPLCSRPLGRWSLVAAVLLSFACSTGGDQPVLAPDVDAANLALSLSALAAGTASSPETTLDEAQRAFEASVEPRLRRDWSPEKVLAVEYRFALLRVAVQDGRRVEVAAEAVQASLEGQLGSGPLAVR